MRRSWLLALALLAAAAADIIPHEPAAPDDGASDVLPEPRPHPLAGAHPLSAVLVVGLVASVAAAMLSTLGFLPSRRTGSLLMDPTARESLAPAAAELL